MSTQWGDPVQRPLSVSTQDIELVLGPQRNYLSRASAGFSESDGGLGVKSQAGLIQMGTRRGYFSAVDGEERSIHNQLICIPTISKTPRLLQLEVRHRSNSSECLVPALGGRGRICLLSLLFDRLMQDQVRDDSSDCHNTPVVEIPSMVPPPPSDVGGTTSTSRPQESTNRPTGELASHGIAGPSTISCLDCVRNTLQD